MTYLLFEDSNESPISKLLKDNLSIGDRLIFSKGSQRIDSKISSILLGGNSVVCYYDLVYDNTATVDGFRKLKNKYRNNANVILVPIPCIEYYDIVMLILLNVEFSPDILRIIDFLYYKKSECTANYKEKSLEKFFKGCLNSLHMDCYKNKVKAGNDIFGKFYMCSCNCGYAYCKFDAIELTKKAILLYTLLPLVVTDISLKYEIISYGIKQHYKLNINNPNKGLYDRICKFIKYDGLRVD